jgi:hypothetical protein
MGLSQSVCRRTASEMHATTTTIDALHRAFARRSTCGQIERLTDHGLAPARMLARRPLEASDFRRYAFRDAECATAAGYVSGAPKPERYEPGQLW